MAGWRLNHLTIALTFSNACHRDRSQLEKHIVLQDGSPSSSLGGRSPGIPGPAIYRYPHRQ